ncbi:MAG: PilZ domain-containing protein [Candidatus Eremiobacterota bacterium]
MFKSQIQGFSSSGGASLEERRRMIRVRCYCHVRVVRGEEVFKGVVTDLGLDGLRLKCPATLCDGETVEIHYPDAPPGAPAGPVRGQVIWSQPHARYVESLSGLRYADSTDRSWVRLVLQELGFDDVQRVFQRRKFIRADASIPARLYPPNSSQLSARVVNMGVGGALMETAEEFPNGTSVTLEVSLWRILPTLSLSARTLQPRRDQDNGLVLTGLEFSELGPEQVDLLGKYVVYLLNQSAS